jgi:RNA polymerase sigma factor (TIGR02999 family)
MPEPAGDITLLLQRSAQGDSNAAAALFPVVYRELRALAGAMMRSEGPITLQPTALVNEAYVKLVSGSPANVNDRDHFFRLAAKVMRQVLIDHAREKKTDKRGGDINKHSLTLDIPDPSRGPTSLDLLALDDALLQLAQADPRKAELVELRFFAGLTNEQTASVTGLSLSTIEREWRFARAWLLERLGNPQPNPPSHPPAHPEA